MTNWIPGDLVWVPHGEDWKRGIVLYDRCGIAHVQFTDEKCGLGSRISVELEPRDPQKQGRDKPPMGVRSAIRRLLTR